LTDGDEAILHSLPSLPGKSITAKIERHAKAFGSGSRMMRAEIDLANPVDPQTGRRMLMPGDYGKVTITLKQFNEIPTVPKSAIQSKGSAHYAMVIGADNTLALRNVEIAVEDGDRVGIASGLEVGERVIASKPGAFQHGQAIDPDALEQMKPKE